MICLFERRSVLRLCAVAWMGLLFACTPSTVQEFSSLPALPTVTGPPEPNEIRQRIRLPQGAGAVAFGDGSIWAVVAAERQILRLDRETGALTDSPIALDFEPGRIAYGERAAWVVSADHTRLARIDPQTNAVVAEIDLRSLEMPEDVLLLIAAGEGGVWLTDQTRVIQIDPQTNKIAGTPLPVGEEIIAVGTGHGTLWAGSHDDGLVSRVDPETHAVIATIDMGFSVHGLAVSDESAWVLDEHGFAVVRIDPQTNQLRESIPIDFIAANLTAGAGSVWVAPAARDSGSSTGNDGIARIAEKERQLVATIQVGDVPASEYYSVYFSEGSVWVLVSTAQASLVEITP